MLVTEFIPDVFSGHSTEKKENYYKACEWLQSIGVDFKKTRFGEYKKDFQLFCNPNRNTVPNDPELFDEFYSYMQSQLEAVQLIRLMNTYKNRDLEGFIDRFRNVVTGKKLRHEAITSNSDKARDYAFELSVASRFLVGGFSVDINQIADIESDINSKKLFVECKRIKSKSQLDKRVKEANKQILKRVNSCISKKARGIIALDLTDLINPTSAVIVCSSVEQFYRASVDTIHEFIYENIDSIKKGSNKKCLGALCEKTSIGFITGKDEPIIAHARGAAFYNYSSDEYSIGFIEEFLPKIGNQNI